MKNNNINEINKQQKRKQQTNKHEHKPVTPITFNPFRPHSHFPSHPPSIPLRHTGPPGQPVVELKAQGQVVAGSLVEFTCITKGGHPPPKVR